MALCSAILLLLALSAKSSVQQASPIVPLASRTLMLDISTAGDRILATGEHGVIVFSDDNGDSWQQASVPTSQMLTGIHFADARNGWAVGHDGLILVSEDGGKNWRIQRDGLAAQQQINLELREAAHHEIARLNLLIEGADEDALPELELALEDAGFDLEDAEIALAEPVFASPFMDVWFKDANKGWAIGAFGTFLGTTDGGQHWVSLAGELDNPDEYHLNAITGDSSGRIFVAGEGGVMFRSMDGGQQWETLEPFYEGSWFGTVFHESNNTLFIFGLRGNIYRSGDFGSSWQLVENDSNTTLAGGSASDQGDVLMVGGVGTVLFSSDHGQSFQRIMIPDRLSLSSALSRDGKLIMVGQGGVKTSEIKDHVK